ncbi:MAG: hypothetical protein L0226_11310, partial [Acidobacteria bacterium]|nr:hypothetical protein [Acidobacteriota bacterium]
MYIAREEKLEQLDKILQGRTLHGSENLRAFLRFIVDKSIDNQDSQVKEYVIATEVFGRARDFDPRIDSVVRVQAGRLRVKLQEYYTTEGKDDQVIIDLPKGQYMPVFSYAQRTHEQGANGEHLSTQPLAGDAVPGSAVSSAATSSSAVPGSSKIGSPGIAADHFWADALRITESRSAWQRIWAFLTIAAVPLAVLFLVLTLFYRAKTAEFSKPAAVGAPGETEALDRNEIEPLWGGLLRSTEPILVVYSNTLFRGTAEEGMKLLKSLDAPGSSLGSPIIPQSEIEVSKEPVIEHYTGIGEVMGSYLLGDFFAKMHHAARVKRSLLLTWEDMKTENIVVLGSPAENLFLRDLPQKQDFIFKPNLPNPDDNRKKAFGIINTRPQPGEQQYYLAKQGGPSRSQISEDYAVVSLLEGLNAENRLLILAGITTLGTQASVEYVTKPDYIRDLIKHLNTASAGKAPRLPANYQVLVKVKVNGGVPVQVSYVTHH